MACYLFPKTVFGFYRELARKYWLFIGSLLILRVILQVFSNVTPSLFVKWIADGATNATEGVSILYQMAPTIATIAIMVVLVFASDIAYEYILEKYWPLVRMSITQIIYQRLSQQSVAFFKDSSAGFLVEQAGLIGSRFRTILLNHTSDLLILLFSLTISAGIMFQIHWQIAMVFGIAAITRFGWCALHTKPLWATYKKIAKLSSVETAKHVDSLSNFMKIKLFARKNDEQIYLNKTRLERARARQHAGYLERKFWIFPNLVEHSLFIVTIILTLHLFQSGQINIGEIAFSIISFKTMIRLVARMTWKMPEMSDDLASVVQAYADIAKPIAITDCYGAKNLRPKDCMINFDNVSFKYADGQWVLKDFNLCIQPGEKVGVVGLSGSGKSTLLYLLMRLYDVNEGAVKIDGKDIRVCSMDSLRGAVSFVPQDCTLFNRTLAENISYGAARATKSDIVKAAKMASAHDFIMKTANGYGTVCGDRGVALSGGQRQRIAIAHAICKNSPIIVMDEATSALDSETELAVQSTLEKIFKGRTAVVVAHRLSTLRQMDRIIVLDKGKIVEEGSHDELLKKKDGIYAKLWSMQSSGFIK